MAGYAFVRCGLVKRRVSSRMASRTIGFEVSSLGAPYRWHMIVLIVSLQRLVAGRMAIHAARMSDYLGDLREERARTIRGICYRLKLSGGFQRLVRRKCFRISRGMSARYDRQRERGIYQQ